ncbi:hypothetical protein BT69DRAFT_1348918 [Atractiella rhizophila]|nr:hypothetical protein BT69DRAFT_1348918 [Atractiella rhizophila]
MSNSNRQAGNGTDVPTAVERLQQLSRITGYTIVTEKYPLWLEAITHSSHSTAVKGANGGLARLGDVAMKTVQTAVLYRAGKGDDPILHTRAIQGRLSQRPLKAACKRIKLENLAYYNMSEFPGSRCADLVKAIIGAVYIDCVSRDYNPMEYIEEVMDNLGLLYDPEKEQWPEREDEQEPGPGQEQEQDVEATSGASELTTMGSYHPSSTLGYNQPSGGQGYYQPIANQMYHQPNGNPVFYQRHNNQGYNPRGSSQGQYQQTNYEYY